MFIREKSFSAQDRQQSMLLLQTESVRNAFFTMVKITEKWGTSSRKPVIILSKLPGDVLSISTIRTSRLLSVSFWFLVSTRRVFKISTEMFSMAVRDIGYTKINIRV